MIAVIQCRDFWNDISINSDRIRKSCLYQCSLMFHHITCYLQSCGYSFCISALTALSNFWNPAPNLPLKPRPIVPLPWKSSPTAWRETALLQQWVTLMNNSTWCSQPWEKSHLGILGSSCCHFSACSHSNSTWQRDTEPLYAHTQNPGYSGSVKVQLKVWRWTIMSWETQ